MTGHDKFRWQTGIPPAAEWFDYDREEIDMEFDPETQPNTPIFDDEPIDVIICPECESDLILFTGFEMYGDNPIAKNYHCEACDTHFSEEYGDGPFE